MKTAIFIREGRTQVVLTPENEWEEKVCEMVAEGKKDLNLYFSQFTDVRGGWSMQSEKDYRGQSNNSLIIVLDKKEVKK